MKAIGSSSATYSVYVRGMDKPIVVSPTAGQKLTDYLTGNETKQFVSITDVKKVSRVVRTLTIDRVEVRTVDASSYKTVAELGLPELTR